jgi:hypothetical protein
MIPYPSREIDQSLWQRIIGEVHYKLFFHAKGRMFQAD